MAIWTWQINKTAMPHSLIFIFNNTIIELKFKHATKFRKP